MSDLRVTNLRGRIAGSAPTLPDGAVVTGVITATTFSGNATSATTASGLTGSPSISVSGVNNTGVSTLTDARIRSVGEKSSILTGTTLSLVYNTGGGNIAIHTNPSADVTLAVTGVPTDSSFDNTTISFSVVLNNTGTARSCTAVTLNGYSTSIKWFGGSLANAISGVTTSTGFDTYNFTGINTVGSASTTANYVILGSVNGSYR